MPLPSTTSKSKLPKTKIPSLCYVYCAVEGSPAPIAGPGMPEGSPPRALVVEEGLTLVVSDVPASVYGASVLEPKLADLDWVAAAGAAHHEVIDALADHGLVVLPFRLFTLFSTDTKATQTMTERRPALTRAFERVRGKQEWVLRIGKPTKQPGEQGSGRSAEDPAVSPAKPHPTGTGFLQAKADARREAAARAQRIKEDAAAAFEALELLADTARTRPVDANGHLLLDAAFLVPPSRVDAVREALTRQAERLLQEGCAVSLTGPWPPYSFASVDFRHE
jgi:hypothetical protein